jgi:hypothetical protein
MPWKSHIFWCVAAIGATALFSVPLLFLLVANGNHLPFSHETLAFRYFANVRILNGEGGDIYLPQGQLITLVQHVILLVLGIVSGHSFFDLRPMVEWYATATNIVTSAFFCVVAFAIALDRRLTWFDRSVILLAGPLVVLATGRAGFYYTLLPDYFGFDVVITIASAYLAIALLRDPRPFRWHDLIIAGLFWGIAGSNKLTLLGPAGLVVVMAAARFPFSLRSFIARSASAVLLAVIAFLTIFLLCYLGQPSQALLALKNWTSFLSAAGAESGFWDQNAVIFLRTFHYDLIAVAWLLAMAALALAVTRRREWSSRTAALWVGVFGVSTLLVVGLVKRGAGTTSFEIAIIATGMVGLAFAAALGPHPRWQLGVPILILTGYLAYSNFDVSHNWSVVSRSSDLARRSWEIHDYIDQIGAPRGQALIVIPDFSYLFNGVEDLTALGMTSAGTPGAAIATRSPLRPVRFVPNAGDAKFGDVLVEPIRHDFGKPAPIAELPCRVWIIGYSEQLSVKVCPVGSEDSVHISKAMQ